MRTVVMAWVVAGLAACAKADKTGTDKAATIEQPHDSVSVVDTAKPEAPLADSIDPRGPRLVVDSAAKQPSLEFRDGGFIVHLPQDMARVLADSLPGFTPLNRAAFDREVTWWMDHYADRRPPSLDPADSSALWATVLSAVVGDFNGDSKRDVAMEGIAGDGHAVFFLLSASDINARPVLLPLFSRGLTDAQYYRKQVIEFLTLVLPGKQSGFTEEGDAPILDLRHDAVEYTFMGKASSIYYVEKGVVRQFTTSD